MSDWLKKNYCHSFSAGQQFMINPSAWLYKYGFGYSQPTNPAMQRGKTSEFVTYYVMKRENQFKEHKPIGGFFISEDIMGMDHIENISGEHKNEHIIIKKFNNGEGTIDVDVNIDDEMDIDKIIKEAEGNPNMIIKIDSTSKNGKKEVRIEVKKEIHSKH